MLRSIPPKTSIGSNPQNRKIRIPKISLNLGTSSFGTIKSRRIENSINKSFTSKKGREMHQYQRMGCKTLEKLLMKAYELKEEMVVAIQILPSDENQEKLEKLGLMIERLKHQIESRR